jgi:hypothetical protein
MAPVYKLSASSIKGRTNYGSMLAGNTAFVLPYFESIATVSVGSGGAANVEFTSIPATFTHLQVRAIARTTRTGSSGNDYLGIKFNSDSGSNYAYHLLYGNGSTVTAQASTSSTTIYNGNAPRDGATASIYGVNVFDILDYANTNKYKTVRTLGGADTNGAGQITFSSGLWMSTSAITSITLSPESDSWKQYSTFALYGIRSA